ncbi:hypothetical protein HHL17_08740 [Chitinophaga sp. G-6-1-13]|uniref:Uncharacterized protein n=1 Tax=Chitinophaga fulva TaxID=2728842 RepID=A0A848GFN1_9BACT|nr:hypothetical protein [Chitinophaga fulva]NML37284.1 hypothetical protein [Chitinophaga fulva]
MSLSTYDDLCTKIAAAGGKPLALEAVWDGDTEGWHLCLTLYTRAGRETFYEHFLGSVEPDTNFRIPDEESLRSVEAFLVNQWGQMAAVQYGLEFYFPSPDEYTDDCPRWPQRHLGVSCADCGKLMLKEMAARHKGVCFHCDMNRESNRKLKTNAPGSRHGIFASVKDDNISSIVRCTNGKGLSIVEGLEMDTSTWKSPSSAIVEIVITEEDILRWKEILHGKIKIELSTAKSSLSQVQEQRFSQLKFEGQTYYFGKWDTLDYASVTFLMGEYEPITAALAQKAVFKIFYFHDLSAREDSFMRSIHFGFKGQAATTLLINKFKKILTPEEVITTLKQMEERGLLNRQGDQLTLTTLSTLVTAL